MWGLELSGVLFGFFFKPRRGFFCPFLLEMGLFNGPPAIPFTSGRNFGSEVVPSIKNGMLSAFILKARALAGLTVPAPVTVPSEGTTRSILSARVPSGDT